jgi:hypothetical protein
MDRYSILDQHSPAPESPRTPVTQHAGSEPAPSHGRYQHGSISAAIAAVNAAAGPAPSLPPPVSHGLRFPGDDGGRSLAEMAQRDLDAALQLLADRAQYITGASGAAIALRRDGRNDMLCRASSGSNAPEMGALLSTESGLSGESVRTRLPLRCDDTERDPRVNREGCRELGIASVLILPILGEHEVLGVFELFSGEVNAFTERDLSALQRLGEMVETALKLTQVAGNPTPETFAAEIPGVATEAVIEEAGAEERLHTGSARIFENQGLRAQDFAGRSPDAVEIDEPLLMEIETEVVPPEPGVAAAVDLSSVSAKAAEAVTNAEPEKIDGSKKPLLWSAALSTSSPARAADADQSHIPAMLRNLKQCKACGFPVSEGRTLCVECEEKKWRGQLRVPATPTPALPPTPPAKNVPAVDYSGATQFAAARPAPAAEALPERASTSPSERILMPSPAPAHVTAGPLSVPSGTQSSIGGQGASPSATALVEEKSATKSESTVAKSSLTISPATPGLPFPPASLLEAMQSQAAAPAAMVVPAKPATTQVPEASTAEAAPESVPEVADSPMFSGGLSTSKSWFSANKYILGAIILIAGIVAGIMYLR